MRINKYIKTIGILALTTLLIISCDKQVSVSQPEIHTFENAKVFIDSKPNHAEIFVDGKNTGLLTPDTVRWLSKGKHNFLLRLNRFPDIKFALLADSMQLFSYYYNYYSDPNNYGAISFKSTPDSAAIYLNDSLLDAITPYTKNLLFPDRYKVKFTYPEHRAESTYVNLSGGVTEQVFLSLPDTSQFVTYNDENSKIPGNTITDILVDNENTLWVGTSHEGLVKIKGSKWEFINKENSALEDNVINRIKKDADNNIWLATYFSIVKITPTGFFVYTKDNSGLPGEFVTDFDFDNNGNVWIGTKSGLAKFDGSNWTTYNVNNSGIPGDFVTAVAIEHDDNSIWIGTSSFGIAQFDGNSNWKYYKDESSSDTYQFLGNRISALVVDHNNVVWGGHKPNLTEGIKGGISRVRKDRLFRIDIGLPNNLINKFYLADDNVLWIGTRSGLVRFVNEVEFSLIDASNSNLPINDILSVYPDRYNNLWIGTNGRGLIKFKGGLNSN